MFNKEKRQQKAAAEAEAKRLADENAEFEAKYAAKQEKKKVEKVVSEMDKICQNLMQKAAEARMKGQGTVYKTYVQQIKIARARKNQAENFLAQVEAMEGMRSIANSSKELLDSMGVIMNSIGKLTLDRAAMAESQKDFMKVQQGLEKQSATIDQYLSGAEMMLPDDEMSSLAMAEVDSDIDAEIAAFMTNNTLNAVGSATYSQPSAAAGVSDDIDNLKKMLNS